MSSRFFFTSEFIIYEEILCITVLKFKGGSSGLKSAVHLIFLKMQYVDLFLIIIIYVKSFSWFQVRLGTACQYPSLQVCSYRKTSSNMEKKS